MKYLASPSQLIMIKIIYFIYLCNNIINSKHWYMCANYEQLLPNYPDIIVLCLIFTHNLITVSSFL